MGRPINKKYFGTFYGNITGTGGAYSAPGGESLSSITYTNRGSAYSQGLTATVAASPIGGTTATISLAISTANGRINTATITEDGSGYTTAPTITLNKPANVVTTGTTYGTAIVTVGSTDGLYVGMAANVGFDATETIVTIHTGNANVVMSAANTSALSDSTIAFGDIGASGSLTAVLAAVATTANTIQANAWTASGSVGSQADIVAQKGSRRYRVTNTDGTSVCRLVANAAVVSAGGPTGAGEMTITATDSDGGVYYVKKLTGYEAVVYPDDGTQFTEDQKVLWTITTAEEDVSIKLSTND